MIAQQDYELAEQLMNADLSFQHDKDENGDPDYPSITKKVYHLEAILFQAYISDSQAEVLMILAPLQSVE